MADSIASSQKCARPERPGSIGAKTQLHPGASNAARQASLQRHARKCTVCHHPDREEIEEQFTHWRSPSWITRDFELEDCRVLYRHAHATGLYEERRSNYLFTLENVLECGDEIQFTAAAYIKAVRAYACLCENIHWTEPVSRVTHDYYVHTEPRAPEGDGSPTSTLPRKVAGSAVDGAVPSNAAGNRSSLSPAHLIEKASVGNRGTGSQPVDDATGPTTNKQDTVVSSTLLPPARLGEKAAVQNSAPPAISVQGSRATEHGARPSASSDDHCLQFLAAAIPILGATPKVVAELKKAGLSDLAVLAANHLKPTSNRHIPELESGPTHRKQRPEVLSNRHKITK